MGYPQTSQSLSLESLSTAEKAFSRNRRDGAENPHIQLLNLLYREGKQRVALALAHDGQELHPLERLRVFIENSQFENADEELQSLKRSLESLEGAEKQQLHAELLLEEGRLLGLHGRWEMARDLLSTLIALKPNTITLASALQVRATVLFELGDFVDSLRDLETLESLTHLYPDLAVKLYGSVLRIKIQARNGYRMLMLSKKSIQALWNQNEKNPETALTLLRLEIDCLKQEKKPYLSQAVACYWLAHHMGDLLYAALALIDIYASIDPAEQSGLLQYMNFYLKRFPRAQVEFEKRKDQFRAGVSFDPHLFNTTATLVICDQNLVFHKVAGGIETLTLPNRDQLFQAIHLLSQGPLSKDEFFRKCWKKRSFSLFLHDNLVRTLLSRIRKDAKIHVESKSKSLDMQGVFSL